MQIATKDNNDEIINIATEQYLYVYNFACKLTNDRDAALDFTQDAFRKAILKTDTFRDAPTVNNVRAWLTTIVKRTIIDAARRRNTKPTIVEVMPHHRISELPFDRYEAADLHTAINSLPDKYKELIEHLLIGYQYNELATKLNLPIGTVKTHLFKSRVILRKYMTELGYDKYYSPKKRSNIATESNRQKKVCLEITHQTDLQDTE